MSVHFEYQGEHYELPDGTTPDVAKSKIMSHLGQDETQPGDQRDEGSLGQIAKDAFGGIESFGRSFPNMFPAAIDATAKAYISMAGGKNSKEALNELSQNPAPTIKPFTNSGELADELSSKIFSTMARAPAAAVQAAIQNNGQTGAQNLVNDPTAIGPNSSEAALALAGAFGVAHGAVNLAKEFKSKIDPQVEAYRAAQANKDKETTSTFDQKTPEGEVPFPEIPEGEGILTPGSEKINPQPTEAESPLPVLPDQLKPLSEQYPNEIPIGAVEGGIHPDTTPLPVIPKGESGLLSLADIATKSDGKPIPELNFPLRQEVLQQPEVVKAVEGFKEEAQNAQFIIDNAIDTKAKVKAAEHLDELKTQFGEYMQKYGITDAGDATGASRPLYEAGRTSLPIEKTYSRMGGVGKKQGGAFDPSIIAELAKRLVPEDLARLMKMPVEKAIDVQEAKLRRQIATPSRNRFFDNARDKSIENTKQVLATLRVSRTQRGSIGFQQPRLREMIDKMNSSIEEAKALQYTLQKLENKPHPTVAKAREGPLGQSAFGKNQRGSIGFGKKDPSLEEYTKLLSAKLGEQADPLIAKSMYEKEYPIQPRVNKALSGIPGLSKFESRDPTDVAGSVSRMEEVGHKDLTSAPGPVFRNTMPAGRLQSWSLKSPIVHEGISFITSVKDSYRIKTSNLLSDITSKLNFFEKGLSKFSNHTWKDAAEVIELRRTNEFNKDFKPESVLSGKQLELFNKIDSTLKDIYTDVNDRRKELNPEAKDLKQLPYYFTSFFKGDWTIPVLGRDGEYLFTLREDSKTNAEKAAAWAKENGTNVGEVGLHKTSQWADKRIDARTDFEQMQDLFGSDDPVIQEALSRMIARADKASMNTRQMPNRFMNKQGVMGSLGDRPWRSERENFNDNKKALDMYITGAQDWLANTQISKWAKEMNNSEKLDAPNAKSFLNDYADYVTGNKEEFFHVSKSFKNGMTELASKVPVVGKRVADYSKFENGLRNLANVNTGFFVGYFSLRMVTQNAIQPFVATMPMMTKLGMLEGLKGNQALALPMGVMKGITDQAQLLFNGKLGMSESAKYKKDNHIVDMHLVESSKMFDNFHANQAYDLVANTSVKVSEHWARNIAFSIYDEYLKSAGIEGQKSLDIAKNLTHETMVNYEQYAKSQVFGRSGLVGEMAGRLQTYKMNSLGQMTMYASDMKKSSPKTWLPMSQSMLMMLATAGAVGFIGMDVAELIWQAVQGADSSTGEQNDWIQENTPKRWIYNNAPEMISMGALSSATGSNLSGAFSQNLVGNSPMQSLVPVLGQTGEQLKAPFNIMSDNSIDKARGLEAVTPNTAKRFIEDKYLSKQGEDGNTTIVSPLSGNPVYHGKGSGYVDDTISNIQTLERGRQSTENFLHKQFSKNISDSEKKLQDKAERITWDFSKGAISQDELRMRLQPLIAHADDPNTIINAVTKAAEKFGVGDTITSELMHGLTLGNRKSVMDAARINEQRQNRK